MIDRWDLITLAGIIAIVTAAVVSWPIGLAACGVGLIQLGWTGSGWEFSKQSDKG